MSAPLRNMMCLSRRFLWIVAFAFWMGGFSFYGGVVITVGAHVVAGGEREFGFITQQVTYWLNVSGGVALGIFLINLLIDWHVPGRLMRWALLAIWLVLGLLHVGLIAIHPLMDRLLDPSTLSLRDPSRFHQMHKIYLGLSSLEWAGSLALLAATLFVWSGRDRGRRDGRLSESSKASKDILGPVGTGTPF